MQSEVPRALLKFVKAALHVEVVLADGVVLAYEDSAWRLDWQQGGMGSSSPCGCTGSKTLALPVLA